MCGPMVDTGFGIRDNWDGGKTLRRWRFDPRVCVMLVLLEYPNRRCTICRSVHNFIGVSLV
jgi:hypothetical protein